MNGGGEEQERQPCGACKHLDRVCKPDCIFEQFFPAHSAGSEIIFAKANESYSVEKMTALILALNSDSGNIITIEARYDLLRQQFNYFHHLRLLRFQNDLKAAHRAAEASSSTNEILNLKNAIADEERRREELGPCVVCEKQGMTCSSSCVYAPYFPAADISAERNLERVENKFGKSKVKDLIERLMTTAGYDQDYLYQMLEFVDFMKKLYLENSSDIATGAEDKSESTSLGASHGVPEMERSNEASI